ncbi:AAA family ATPase [Bacillus sp. FJAT-28004]|uniref:AAA family ATPase n=1 Tax=Bacillus sp. FJAT-28004 TaxID=1679165 RepID=UPI0006B54D7D|nr:AAA family ATPase [Bacillus sp. FJAT-28004]
MRINAITIEAFRGFNEKRRFEFPNTSIVILHGPNGYGKTSFFDAIEWGLTGVIYRYEQDPERKLYRYIGNHFAMDKPPKVTIELVNSDTRITVTRTGAAGTSVKTDGGANFLEVEINGEKVPDYKAEIVLKEKLVHAEWLDKVDLNKSLFLTHLLCQERMNGILRGMKEKERYNSVSRIFGTEQFAVYGDIVHKARIELEERRLAFSQKLGQLTTEEEMLEDRIRGIRMDLTDTSPASRNNQWLSAFHHFVDEFQISPVSEDQDQVTNFIKIAEAQVELLEQERIYLEEDTFRRLELAKDASTSLQDKLPLLIQWEQENKLAQTLDEHEIRLYKLQMLYDNTTIFLQSEQTKMQNEQLNKELLKQSMELQLKADRLFEALNEVKNLLITARNRKQIDGLSGAFALAYPHLEETPRLALYHAL